MDLPFGLLLDAFKYLKESGNKDKDKISAYLDQCVESPAINIVRFLGMAMTCTRFSPGGCLIV